jgi:hypothetical protein
MDTLTNRSELSTQNQNNTKQVEYQKKEDWRGQAELKF